MAKTSAIEKNRKRARMVKKYALRRQKLKATAKDQSLPAEERFGARLKLAEMPRNSSPVRHNGSRKRATGFTGSLTVSYPLLDLLFRPVSSPGLWVRSPIGSSCRYQPLPLAFLAVALVRLPLPSHRG